MSALTTKKLSEFVRAYRVGNKRTQVQFAKDAGVSYAIIRKVEQARTGIALESWLQIFNHMKLSDKLIAEIKSALPESANNIEGNARVRS